MDDYLSESEQLERVREWFRVNGLYIVAGVVLFCVVFFGLRWYKQHKSERNAEAAVMYGQVHDAAGKFQVDDAAGLVTQLREQYAGSPYTAQAGLLLAQAYLSSKPDESVTQLRYVMDHTDDRELGLIARLRLARVLISQMHAQDALNLLAVDKPGEFAARISEVRGDAYTALGDGGAARTAYADALTAPGANWLDRNLLQMKLSALPAPAKQADGTDAAKDKSGSETAAGKAAPAGSGA